jgi:hypothetical protein
VYNVTRQLASRVILPLQDHTDNQKEMTAKATKSEEARGRATRQKIESSKTRRASDREGEEQAIRRKKRAIRWMVSSKAKRWSAKRERQDEGAAWAYASCLRIYHSRHSYSFLLRLLRLLVLLLFTFGFYPPSASPCNSPPSPSFLFYLALTSSLAFPSPDDG